MDYSKARAASPKILAERDLLRNPGDALPSVEELKLRIGRDAERSGGVLSERVAIAWSGYLAALIEWGLLTVSDHSMLCSLLPNIQDDPSVRILAPDWSGDDLKP